MSKKENGAVEILYGALDKMQIPYNKTADGASFVMHTEGKPALPVSVAYSSDTAVLGFSAYAPFGVPAEKRRHMALAIAAVNLNANEGGFCYNFENGTLLFYVAAYTGHCNVDADAVLYKTFAAYNAMARFVDTFKKICLEELSEKEAVKLATEVN